MRIRLSGLLPGSDYNLQLRSSDGQNVSGWSRIFPITTIKDNVPPKTPANFTWEVSGTSFIGQWDEVTESADDTPILDFDYYEMQLWDGGQFVYYKTKSTRFELTFERNKGAFGTPSPQVWARVRAVDDSGNQSAFTTQLLATNPVPDPPTSFAAIGIYDAVVCSWVEPADDDIKGYTLHMSTSGAGFTPDSLNQIWFGQATSVTHPTTTQVTHYFKLATVDVFGQTSSYVADDAQPLSSFGSDTEAPDVPTGLAVNGALNAVDAGRADFTLTWTDPTDTDLAGIVVRWRANGETPYHYINVPAGEETTVVRNLWTGVQYDFQIAAFDFSANYSAYTAVESETVNNAAPSRPSAPTLVGSVQEFGVTHDLTKAIGGRLESDVRAIDVYIGETNTWPTANPIKVQTIPVAAGSNVVVSSKIPLSLEDPVPSRWIYVIAVDEGGLESPESDPTQVTVDSLTGAYFEDASIASAKIQNLDANKITAGTGIINDLDVKSTLTVGDGVDPGVIQSYEYVDSSGAAGYSLSDSGLIIKTGEIEAAALKIQNSQNLMPAQYADFEFRFSYYEDARFIIPADTTIAITGSPVKYGVQALQVVCTAATERNLDFAPPGIYNINVEGGTEYIASAYVYQNSGTAKDFKLLLAWDDATSSYSPAISVPTATWTRISFVATAPVAAVNARIGVAFGDPFTFIIDGVQVELKETSATTPSQWKPPSSTSIDGGIIRTGSIQSTSMVDVGAESLPAWLINTQGNAQFSDALVRGQMIVGGQDAEPLPTASFRSASTEKEPYLGVTNLLSNPGFETDTTGWETSGTGSSIVRSTAQAHSGTASGLFTYGATGAHRARTTIATAPSVTPGQRYVASAWLRASSGTINANAQVRLRISWYNSSNVLISFVQSGSPNLTTAWKLYSIAGEAPASAAKVRVEVIIGVAQNASGNAIYIDDVDFGEEAPFMVDKPTGTTEGDLLVAFHTTGEVLASIAPTGGEEWQVLKPGSTVNIKTMAWWKIAGDSEPPEYEFFRSSETNAASGEGAVSIIAIQDATQSVPLVSFLSGGDNSTGDPSTWIVHTPSTIPSRSGLEIRMAATLTGTYTITSNFWTPPQLNDGLVLNSDGGHASTPDAASLDITGDLDIRADITPATWYPPSASGRLYFVTKYSGTTALGDNRSYFLGSEVVDGTPRVRLMFSTDGVVLTNAYSTAAIPAEDGTRIALRATIDVDNGAGGRTVTFYTAPTMSDSWTQLGDPVTDSGTVSIFSGNAPLVVGGYNEGGSTIFTGTIHAVQVRSGIGGTIAANPDFQAQAGGVTSFDDSTGKTWSVIAPAFISDVTNPFTERTDTDSGRPYVTHSVATRRIPEAGSTGVHIFKSNIFTNRRHGFTVNILDQTDVDGGQSRIQSINYDPGIAGWAIFSDGRAELNDVIIREDLTAARLTALDSAFAGVNISPANYTWPSIQFEHPLVPYGPSLFHEYNMDVDPTVDEDISRLVIDSGRPDVFSARSSRITLNSFSETGYYDLEKNDADIYLEKISWDTIGFPTSGDVRVRVVGFLTADRMRPVGNRTITTQDILALGTAGSFYSLGTPFGIAFVAPPSGYVTITWWDRLFLETNTTNSRNLYSTVRVGSGTTIGGGTVQLSPSTNNSVHINRSGESTNTGQVGISAGMSYRLSGLTPGNNYNVEIQYQISSSTGVVSASSNARSVIVRPEM